jgi:hypothetical protein
VEVNQAPPHLGFRPRTANSHGARAHARGGLSSETAIPAADIKPRNVSGVLVTKAFLSELASSLPHDHEEHARPTGDVQDTVAVDDPCRLDHAPFEPAPGAEQRAS